MTDEIRDSNVNIGNACIERIIYELKRKGYRESSENIPPIFGPGITKDNIVHVYFGCERGSAWDDAYKWIDGSYGFCLNSKEVPKKVAREIGRLNKKHEKTKLCGLGHYAKGKYNGFLIELLQLEDFFSDLEGFINHIDEVASDISNILKENAPDLIKYTEKTEVKECPSPEKK